MSDPTIITATRTRETRGGGVLRLAFERRGGRTVLARKYASAPFGAVRANYPDGFGIPEVQITNPSGGILGGDSLEMEVELAPGARATVLTQAANKVYRGDEAVQEAVFRVADGAFLEYLPHHLIPFSRSNYRQRTTFDLAPDATLITWDAYGAGRVTRGERFSFGSLDGRTKLLRDGITEVMDAFHLAGDAEGGAEHFGGYSYLVSAYVAAPMDLAPLAERLHDALARERGTLASASAPARGLCAVRVLTDATALYALLNRSREVARRFLGLTSPAREIS